jgi:CRISPR-associated endonuclease Cas2
MIRLLVSYDIASPRRRRRASLRLLDHGERVQHSVYDLLITTADWLRLREGLDRLIDPVKDQWRAWPACARDIADAVELGLPADHPAQTAVVL